MTDTLQAALRDLYAGLGGNSATVRNESDITDLIRAIGALGIGENLAKASTLPALPEEDGTYALQVTIADGVATYAWESTT